MRSVYPFNDDWRTGKIDNTGMSVLLPNLPLILPAVYSPKNSKRIGILFIPRYSISQDMIVINEKYPDNAIFLYAKLLLDELTVRITFFSQ